MRCMTIRCFPVRFHGALGFRFALQLLERYEYGKSDRTCCHQLSTALFAP